MTVAVVAGALANKPGNGGEAWVRPSWVRGLARLGLEVWLVESLASSSAVDEEGRPAPVEASVNARFFRDVTEAFGLAGRSLILIDGRPAEGDAATWRELGSCCRLLVNISGHLAPDAWFDGIPLRVYVDLDPGYTQVWNRQGLLGDAVRRHHAHYTVGANVGRPGCGVPPDGLRWRPIRPPVLLDEWSPRRAAVPTASDGSAPSVTPATPLEAVDRGLPGGRGAPDTMDRRFTTVAAWRGAFGSLDTGARVLGAKAHEWRRFRDLPGRCPRYAFEAALDIHEADVADRDALTAAGWRLACPGEVAGTPAAYRAYVQGSDAEFSVAQGAYVALRTGWFSDRSARYLAAGRPVLLQDTGLEDTLPVGEGVVPFAAPEDAAAGADRIAADYGAHAEAALRLAAVHFDSDRVLGRFLEELEVRP